MLRASLFLLLLHRLTPISMWMILMTMTLLSALRTLFPMFRSWLFSAEVVLILLFTTTHLFTFYILFEMVLIPLFMMLVVQTGGRARRYLASLWLVLFTLFGSFLFLMALLTVYLTVGSLNSEWLRQLTWDPSLTPTLFWFLFFALAIKLPVFPGHLWLTEAHVESSTPGSVLLAALLLKLGSQGILQFLLPLFPVGSVTQSIVITLGLAGVWQGGWMALRQTDLKKLIAQGSISHMGLNLIALFSKSVVGLIGGMMMIFSHAFSALGLFFLAGALAHRSGSKIWLYHRGLAQTMPWFSILWAGFHLFNLGFPGTLAFMAEQSTFIGLSDQPFILFLCLGGIMLSGAASIWLLSRTLFGSLPNTPVKYQDLHGVEVAFLMPPLLIGVFLGLFPVQLVQDLTLLPFSIGSSTELRISFAPHQACSVFRLWSIIRPSP